MMKENKDSNEENIKNTLGFHVSKRIDDITEEKLKSNFIEYRFLLQSKHKIKTIVIVTVYISHHSAQTHYCTN